LQRVTFLRTLVQRVSVDPASPQTQHQSVCAKLERQTRDEIVVMVTMIEEDRR
jgi:hypothetical protein